MYKLKIERVYIMLPTKQQQQQQQSKQKTKKGK